MKKLVVLALAAVLCVAATQAGVEFVGVDGVYTTYTSNSGVLLMNDSGLVVTIEYDDNTQSSISPASFTLSTAFDSGMLFTGGSFEFTDDGDASVIISGNVLSIEFDKSLGFLVGNGSAQVLVSNLSGYPLGVSDIVSITFNLNPAFTGFDKNYTGDTKVNFVVPEPATLVLLGLGGLLLRKRK